MKCMNGSRCVALVLAVLALARAAGAQSGPTGSLNGRVMDPSLGAVPGVTVSAVNLATNDIRTEVTNGEGVYRLTSLAVGSYQLTYQLDGFKTVRRTGVLVEAAVPRTIDVQLEVGGLAEQVNVVAESPVLQKTTPAVARRLSSEELTSIPSSSRNFTHLLTATAGVSADFDSVDFGTITATVGGPRVSQFGLRVIFECPVPVDRGVSPRRGARIARRDERGYREYLREEQRREAGCPARELCRELLGRDTSTSNVI